MKIRKKILYSLSDQLIKIVKEDNVFRIKSKFFSDWYIPTNNKKKAIWTLEFLKNHERWLDYLNVNDIIIEVGTATGEFTIPAAKRIGPKGCIHAFEADSNNFTCLQKNIKLYNISNIIAKNNAVSNISGKELLFTNENSFSSHRLSENGNRKVTTMSLDDYFHEDLDMLKITVNGHEKQVLEGAVNLLKKTKLVNLPTLTSETDQFLKNQGFSLIAEKSGAYLFKKISNTSLS